MKKLFFLMIIVAAFSALARGAPVLVVNENDESSCSLTGKVITGAEMIQNSNEVGLVAGVAQPTVIPIRTEFTSTIITNPTNQNESSEGIQTKKDYSVASDMNQQSEIFMSCDIDFTTHQNSESGGGIQTEEVCSSLQNFTVGDCIEGRI